MVNLFKSEAEIAKNWNDQVMQRMKGEDKYDLKAGDMVLKGQPEDFSLAYLEMLQIKFQVENSKSTFEYENMNQKNVLKHKQSQISNFNDKV